MCDYIFVIIVNIIIVVVDDDATDVAYVFCSIFIQFVINATYSVLSFGFSNRACTCAFSLCEKPDFVDMAYRIGYQNLLYYWKTSKNNFHDKFKFYTRICTSYENLDAKVTSCRFWSETYALVSKYLVQFVVFRERERERERPLLWHYLDNNFSRTHAFTIINLLTAFILKPSCLVSK